MDLNWYKESITISSACNVVVNLGFLVLKTPTKLMISCSNKLYETPSVALTRMSTSNNSFVYSDLS